MKHPACLAAQANSALRWRGPDRPHHGSLPHPCPSSSGSLPQGRLMQVSSSQAAALANEIAHLRGLDREGLRARWRSLTGRAAPAHVPRQLLLQVLAYRLQVAALGDLDQATVRLLDRLASQGRSSTHVIPVPDRIGLRPGTVLSRARPLRAGAWSRNASKTGASRADRWRDPPCSACWSIFAQARSMSWWSTRSTGSPARSQISPSSWTCSMPIRSRS